MEFTLPAGALATAVGLVKGCVPSRTTVPILNHVLVEARAGEIHVRGTNLEMEAAARSGADVAADGVAALPGDILHGIVKHIGRSDLVTVKLEGSRASLAGGRSRYDLRALPPDDFPVAKTAEDGATFTIAAKTLAALFASTRYALSKEESRWYLKGVNLCVSGEKLIATAADGHRLARRWCALPAGAASMPSVIVPADAVREMGDTLGDAEGDATVTVNASRIRVAIKDFTISSALIGSDFPNVDALIPPVNGAAVTVRTKALAEALERAFVVYQGTDVKAPAAKFVAGSKGLDLTAGVPGMDVGTEDVEATVHERGAVFSMNARYLAEMLKLWPDVDLDIQPNGPGAPILFTAKDVPDMTHIIMPQIGRGERANEAG